MTFIKKLEMRGFKSFANKVVVDLSKGFSAFIGANGSGKSNVVDALCFVLGKASKKSMRANLLSDLIFNGGKKGRPAKFAEVSLVFDNQNNYFPYDGDEFRISRRVLSEGRSIYKINGKTVKRQEVINSLLRANIDPDGFNIILQGDIQKFVSLSGDERREVIEDVSGISVYEDKKRKSIRELEKVDEKLKEARTRLAERERYLKEIKNDKKQAEKYLKMKDELRDRKASLLFKKIHNLETQRSEFDDKIEKNKELLEKADEEIEHHHQRITGLTDELTEVKAELARRGDSEQQLLAKKLEQVKDEKMELGNVITNHNRELKRIKERKSSITSELKELDYSIKEAKKELKKLNDEINKLGQEITSKKQEGGVDQLSKVNKLKEELLTIEEELSRLNNELLIAKQSEDYSSELSIAEKKLDGVKTKLKRVNHSLDQNDSKRSELYAKKREVKEYLTHLNSKKIKLEAESNASINYGARGVKSVIKAGLPGVHGTLSSLGLTDKRFTTALNVAAGSRLNAIVTEDDSSAQKCIEYLRSKKAGTAAFIPLNKVKGFNLSDKALKLRKKQGVIDYAINLIKFDSRYRKAFELVLRNTLIVQDLETTRSIGFGSVRMVTVKGDVVETSGLMTGGYRGKTSTGFISKDLNEQLSDIMLKKRKYERYKQEIIDSLKIVEEEVVKNREEKARLEILINELTEKIEGLSTKVQDAGNVNELSERIERLTNHKKEIKQELTTSVDEQVIRAAKQEIKQLEKEHSELLIKRGTKEAEFNKVLMKEKERFNEIINELDSEASSFKKELKEAKKNLSSTKKKLKELKKEESKFYKKLKELYDKRDDLSKKIEDNEKRISKLKAENYSIKERNQELSIKRASIVAKLDGLRVAFEEFDDWEPRLSKKKLSEIKDDINKLEVIIKNFGPVNMKSIETYKEVEKEFDKIKQKTEELTNEKQEIINVIDNIELKKREAFLEAFKEIKNNFERIFARLSPGGIAKLMLENKEDPFEGGITAVVRPKGKKILTLKSMSGGEKTLTALAFIFSLQEYNPAPFYIMDEVDAALDKNNTQMLAEMVSNYGKDAQFLVVSHNDELISASDYLYGISMNKQGVSSLVSVKLPD